MRPPRPFGVWLATCLVLVPARNALSQTRAPGAVAARSSASVPDLGFAAAPRPRPSALVSLTFADLGFGNGIRFANLGGRREIFVQLPQGAAVNPAELVLALDDISAHEARRNLEILVNDRSAAAVALDGRGTTRTVRIPLGGAKTADGFLKLAFQYSGAATQDRCIDVRSIGDSLTIRPESAVDVEADVCGNIRCRHHGGADAARGRASCCPAGGLRRGTSRRH